MFNLKTVIQRGGKHFMVSTVNVPFSGWETLVFPCNAEGRVSDFLEVGGRRWENENEAINGHETFTKAFNDPAVD